MDLYEIGKAIRDDLRTNIKDPIDREGEWIHYDEISLEGKTPAIFIERVPSSTMHEFVGSGEQLEFPRYQVAITVKVGDTGAIDDTMITNWKELLDKIAKKVIDRMETISTSINTTYVAMLHRLPIGGIIRIDNVRRGLFMVFEVQPK